MAQYLPRKFVALEADRIDGSAEQAARLGITLLAGGAFQCPSPRRWICGRVGDWLARWPNGSVEVYQDTAFHAMFQKIRDDAPPGEG